MRTKLGRFFAAKRKGKRRILQLHQTDVWLPINELWYPDVLKLQPVHRQLLQSLRRELSNELGPDTIVSDLDVLYFALQELASAMKPPGQEDTILKLLFYLSERRERAETRSNH